MSSNLVKIKLVEVNFFFFSEWNCIYISIIFCLVHVFWILFVIICTLPCKSSFLNLVLLAQLSPNHPNLESGHDHISFQEPASDMHSACTLFCLVSNVCAVMSQIYRTSSTISCHNKTVNSDTQLVNICFGELSVDQTTIHLTTHSIAG